jgi:DNA invertase Pin-like site-specific DNA recombinase
LDRRDALKQLIQDVAHGTADFSTILVYDVSRWGRFQDIDESAHYEFVCRQAGVTIQYCAEQFENNNSASSQIMKTLKRVMAGEFSRELSVKVLAGHKRGAGLGFRQGSIAGYGFRRLIVDASGKPKTFAAPGERKFFQTDRVVLVPGPHDEIRTIRKIYRLFVIDRMPQTRIAAILNERSLPNSMGNRWTSKNVSHILTNEKYIGNLLFNRTTKRFQGRSINNPTTMWIRAEGAIERIIEPELFARSQKILANPRRFTKSQLLDHLSAAWCANGYLSSRSINAIKCMPSTITYNEAFGRLSNAYHAIGYRESYWRKPGPKGIAHKCE